MVAGNLNDTTGTRRFERAAAQANTARDVLVARQPIVGMLQDDGERLLSEMLAPDTPERARTSIVAETGWAAASVRHCLRSTEGEGYWDFYRPWTGLMLSITDAEYRQDTWVNVEGTGYFKIRMLLSGMLQSRSGEVIARAPETLLYVSPGMSREGYCIPAGERMRMIVLHCRPQLLTQVLGLTPQDIPAPLSSLLTPERSSSRRRMSPSSELIQVTRRIIESSHSLSPALRDRYLQTLSMQLLLQMLGTLERHGVVGSAAAVTHRNASRIHEARDYLAQHFADPPRISQLARRVGLSCTKLKESFRQTVGFTVYEYIMRLRMEHAAEMLVTGDHDVAQVAYAVGYEYPANFTAAFKRHFGMLPRDWKRCQLSKGEPIQ